MKRREFVKTLGATGVALYASDLVGNLIAQSPKARVLESRFKGLSDIVLGEAKRMGCSYADVRFTRNVSDAVGLRDRIVTGGGGFGGGGFGGGGREESAGVVVGREDGHGAALGGCLLDPAGVQQRLHAVGPVHRWPGEEAFALGVPVADQGRGEARDDLGREIVVERRLPKGR